MVMLSAIVLVGCKKKAANDAGTDTDTTTSETTGINFDAMAKDVCGCYSGLVANLAKMETLTAAGDTDAIAALSTLMDADEEKIDKCVVALQSKYPGIDGNAELEAKAEAALVRACPDLAKLDAPE